MKRSALLFCTLLLVVLSAYGQETGEFLHLTSEQGLSNNFVVSVDIDRYGAVWIGTEDGMNRYDGVSVRRYSQSSGILPGNGLNQVLADADRDAVWVATQRAGLSRFDYGGGVVDTFLPCEAGIAAKEITHMEQDGEGNLWISTYLNGLDCFHPSTGTFTHYNSSNVEGMEDYRIHCFTLGADGKVYIGHYGEGVTILDPVSRTALRLTRSGSGSDPHSLPSNIIGCVYRDPDNNIWFGTWFGLALYRPVTRDFLVFGEENAGLPRGEIFSVLVTRDRKILVSPDFQGVWAADIDSLSAHPSFAPLPQASEFSDIGVHAMCEDRFGNLWLGSYGRGVLLAGRSSRPFRQITYPGLLSGRSVTAVAFTPDGCLAVGTEGGQIDILDREFCRKEDDPRALDTGRSILSATIDTDGQIWVGSFLSRTRVYGKDGSFRFEIPVTEARCYLEQGGRMWVGSGNGLFLVDRHLGTVIHRLTRTNGLPENFLRSLAVDRQGNLWVGTFGSGVVVLNPAWEPIATFQADMPSASNMVNALFCDREGRMWAGTGTGLVRYDLSGPLPSVDTTFSLSGSLQSEFIRAIGEDANGNIWFSTNLSICLLDTGSGRVTEYGYRNHIVPGNYQNGAMARRDDGFLCFGSTDGITGFFPESVRVEGAAPGVHLSELNIFTAGGVEAQERTVYLCGRDEIRLNYRENSFFLTFSADNFDLARQTEFSYRLEGENGNWYPAEDGHILNFRQLRPGKYRVHVRSRLIPGDWSPETASLLIRISPPWWSAPAAKVLYVILAICLLGMGGLFFLHNVQRENELKQEKAHAKLMQETNEERLRFYTNITHELRTPLTLILSPAEDLVNDESLSEKAKAKARVLLQNANRLLDLINTLLNFRKTETRNMQNRPVYGDLSAMVEGIGRVFREAHVRADTSIVLEVEKGILAEFDPDIVTSILNNLLSNAVKYTPSGTITLALYADGDRDRIRVADTGYGIPADQLEKIFQRYYQVQGAHQAEGTGIGLALVKNLVELSGWEIDVESEPGRGSIFTVTLPSGHRGNRNDTLDEDVFPVSQEPVSKPIVLVVDDNDDIRSYVRETLSDDYTILQARDGREGWTVILRTVPDLVVCDIMMPVMDGVELCAKIKQDVRVSHVPVILLTAKDTMESRSEGYEAGADSYLTKPFTGSMLRKRIRNLLESRKQLAARFGSALQERREQDVARESFLEIDNAFVRRITDLIEENLSSDGLDVSFLAGELYMSPSTLYRKMKALVGISANEFIRKIRMRKAAEMLASGNFNVSETAWNVGINSLIYFRQCFREEYGCSPSEYRQRTQRSG